MFDGWFATQKPTVTAWFHELHRHPELGFQEKIAAFGLNAAGGHLV